MSDPWVGIVSTLIDAATGVVSSVVTMTVVMPRALGRRVINPLLRCYHFATRLDGKRAHGYVRDGRRPKCRNVSTILRRSHFVFRLERLAGGSVD